LFFRFGAVKKNPSVEFMLDVPCPLPGAAQRGKALEKRRVSVAPSLDLASLPCGGKLQPYANLTVQDLCNGRNFRGLTNPQNALSD
jgi:hypothetical protein